MIDDNDPFSPAADPDFNLETAWQNALTAQAQPCYCASATTPLSRRKLLWGLGAASMIPMVAAAETLRIPCVQESQRITRCRHRFCRHFRGQGDYYGRE